MEKEEDGLGGLTTADCGTYALVLKVEGVPLELNVGSLGSLRFRAGYYCYVGSALKGLKSRLSRHLRASGKRLHWHIDYLVLEAVPVAALVWFTTDRLECQLSRRLGRIAPERADRFGSSDCRCPSHLCFFPTNPVAPIARIHLTDSRGRRLRAHLLDFGEIP